MFIGHIAVGLAAKKATPRLSLAVLIAAALLADMIWPILVLLGVEQVRIAPGATRMTPLDFVSYPWSHSLLMLAVWGLIFGWVVRRRDKHALAVVAALVVSHWVLDVVTHRPDMPLYPFGPRVGLGLWNSVPATVAIEIAMFAAGAWVYFRTTRARDRIGVASIWILLVLLLAIYTGDAISAAPPPSAAAIAVVGIIAGVLFTVWSWWADAHRDAV